MTDQFAEEAAQTAALRQRAEDLKSSVNEMLRQIALANAANAGCVPTVFVQYFENAAQNLDLLELSSDAGLDRLKVQSQELEDVTRACFTCFKLANQSANGAGVQSMQNVAEQFENVVPLKRPN